MSAHQGPPGGGPDGLQHAVTGPYRGWAVVLGVALILAGVVTFVLGLVAITTVHDDNQDLLRRESRSRLLTGTGLGVVLCGVATITFGRRWFGAGRDGWVGYAVMLAFGAISSLVVFGCMTGSTVDRGTVRLGERQTAPRRVAFDLPPGWAFVRNQRHSWNQGTILDDRQSARLYVMLWPAGGERPGELVETRVLPAGPVEVRRSTEDPPSSFTNDKRTGRGGPAVRWVCSLGQRRIDFRGPADEEAELLPIVWELLRTLRVEAD